MKKCLVVIVTILLLLTSCTSNSQKSTKDTPDNNQSQITYGADIIVIGAGGAGISAAIEASDAGASVLIIEKMPMIGGNTLRSEGGLNAAESKPQKDAGIDDGVQDMIDDTIKGGKELNNPELVKFFAENSKDAIDWLTKLGIDVSEVAQGAGAKNPRMHRSKGGAKIGGVLIKGLEENLNSRNIKVVLNTEVIKILSDKGKIVGVEAKDLDGNKLKFKSNAVVIATGGFGANEKMFTEYRKDLEGFKTTNHKGATGDGINLAKEVGADMVDMEQIQTNPTVEVTSTTVISESVRGKGAILVNKEGKRFISEMETRDVLSSAILKQTDKQAYLIFDEKVFSSMKGLQDNFKKGIITKAETLKELSEIIEVDSNVLETTIASFNKAVETKKDIEFNRETGLDNKLDTAPYYAINVSPAVHYTMGGIKINTKTEVLDKEDKAIDGLFAAGEVTGGVHGGNRLGGNAVADIIIFGRQAGKSSAEFIKDLEKIEVSFPEIDKTNSSKKQGDFEDGIYSGIGKGHNGNIEIKIEVKDKSISKIDIVKHNETETIFGTVQKDLVNKIIQEQSLDVDCISGATDSSNGLIEAIKDALNK